MSKRMRFTISRELSAHTALILCIAFGGTIYQQSAEAKPRSLDAALSSVQELIVHNQFEEALPILSNIVAKQPGLIEASAMRGVCYYRMEEFDRAVRDFRVYFKSAKEPVPVVYHRFYGLSLVQLQKMPEALEQFNIDVTKDPKVWDYWFDRTELYLVTGQYAKALVDANVLVSLKPDSFRYALRAKIYWKLNHYEKSAQDWTVAIQKAPERKDYYEERAKCYDKLGEKAQAASDRKKRDQDLD